MSSTGGRGNKRGGVAATVTATATATAIAGSNTLPRPADTTTTKKTSTTVVGSGVRKGAGNSGRKNSGSSGGDIRESVSAASVPVEDPTTIIGGSQTNAGESACTTTSSTSLASNNRPFQDAAISINSRYPRQQVHITNSVSDSSSLLVGQQVTTDITNLNPLPLLLANQEQAGVASSTADQREDTLVQATEQLPEDQLIEEQTGVNIGKPSFKVYIIYYVFCIL